MEPQLTIARQLARLVFLLRDTGSTMDDVRETLRALTTLLRESALTCAVADWKLTVDGRPVPSAPSNYEELVRQLEAHGIAQLTVRRFATAAELIKLVRLLAEAPTAEPPLRERMAALKVWNVDVTLKGEEVATATPAPAPTAQHIELSHHLARVRQAKVPLDATMALDELGTRAQDAAAAGDGETVTEILLGISRAADVVADDAVRAACLASLARLATPAMLRLVAERLPARAAPGRHQEYVDLRDAIGRCGESGGAALIAHLMAAGSFDERRVFYNAIVELRTGVPMLIEALGHPQWYVVRNAANLLGEMRETRADVALARLLEHRDERVREAAATALLRLDTPTARAALPRMIQDRSPNVRLHAATAFASAPTRTATPLSSALDVEADGDVQIGIIQALGRLGTPDAVQKLLKAAAPANGGRPRSPGYRVAALEALATARGQMAFSTFKQLLEDTEPAVRDAAKRLLAGAAA